MSNTNVMGEDKDNDDLRPENIKQQQDDSNSPVGKDVTAEEPAPPGWIREAGKLRPMTYIEKRAVAAEARAQVEREEVIRLTKDLEDGLKNPKASAEDLRYLAQEVFQKGWPNLPMGERIAVSDKLKKLANQLKSRAMIMEADKSDAEFASIPGLINKAENGNTLSIDESKIITGEGSMYQQRGMRKVVAYLYTLAAASDEFPHREDIYKATHAAGDEGNPKLARTLQTIAWKTQHKKITPEKARSELREAMNNHKDWFDEARSLYQKNYALEKRARQHAKVVRTAKQLVKDLIGDAGQIESVLEKTREGNTVAEVIAQAIKIAAHKRFIPSLQEHEYTQFGAAFAAQDKVAIAAFQAKLKQFNLDQNAVRENEQRAANRRDEEALMSVDREQLEYLQNSDWASRQADYIRRWITDKSIDVTTFSLNVQTANVGKSSFDYVAVSDDDKGEAWVERAAYTIEALGTPSESQDHNKIPTTQSETLNIDLNAFYQEKRRGDARCDRSFKYFVTAAAAEQGVKLLTGLLSDVFSRKQEGLDLQAQKAEAKAKQEAAERNEILAAQKARGEVVSEERDLSILRRDEAKRLETIADREKAKQEAAPVIARMQALKDRLEKVFGTYQDSRMYGFSPADRDDLYATLESVENYYLSNVDRRHKPKKVEPELASGLLDKIEKVLNDHPQIEDADKVELLGLLDAILNEKKSFPQLLEVRNGKVLNTQTPEGYSKVTNPHEIPSGTRSADVIPGGISFYRSGTTSYYVFPHDGYYILGRNSLALLEVSVDPSTKKLTPIANIPFQSEDEFRRLSERIGQSSFKPEKQLGSSPSAASEAPAEEAKPLQRLEIAQKGYWAHTLSDGSKHTGKLTGTEKKLYNDNQRVEIRCTVCPNSPVVGYAQKE